MDNKIHTDKELAKLAGVGTGTIARYNRVMNSDNEELKKKVLSSKNLSVGEKLSMTEEFQKEVELENARKKSKAVSESNKTRNSNSLQLECNEKEKIKEHSETWTDSQTAKKAGVGTGSVARYIRINETIIR